MGSTETYTPCRGYYTRVRIDAQDFHKMSGLTPERAMLAISNANKMDILKCYEALANETMLDCTNDLEAVLKSWQESAEDLDMYYRRIVIACSGLLLNQYLKANKTPKVVQDMIQSLTALAWVFIPKRSI